MKLRRSFISHCGAEKVNAQSESCVHLTSLVGRLAQFELVAVEVAHPGELPVLGGLAAFEGDSFRRVASRGRQRWHLESASVRRWPTIRSHATAGPPLFHIPPPLLPRPPHA